MTPQPSTLKHEGLGTYAFEATNNLRQNMAYSIIIQPTAQ